MQFRYFSPGTSVPTGGRLLSRPPMILTSCYWCPCIISFPSVWLWFLDLLLANGIGQRGWHVTPVIKLQKIMLLSAGRLSQLSSWLAHLMTQAAMLDKRTESSLWPTASEEQRPSEPRPVRNRMNLEAAPSQWSHEKRHQLWLAPGEGR